MSVSLPSALPHAAAATGCKDNIVNKIAIYCLFSLVRKAWHVLPVAFIKG